MTIKVSLGVEPIDETVMVTVKNQKAGPPPGVGGGPSKEGEKAPPEIAVYSFIAPSVNPVPVEMELGDKLTITLEPQKVIVLDKDQNVARLEDPNVGEIKEQREREAEEERKKLEEHEKDQKKRAENAQKLEREFRKEADETEVPSKAPPFPAPLDTKGEEEKSDKEQKPATQARPTQAAQTSQSPPKGGARDSKEVKSER